jgi:hypothetical protein
MKKKWLYTMLFLFCFGLMASPNNYNKSGKEKRSACEERAMILKQEAAVTEEILETFPLHHLLLSLAEW